VASFAAGLWRQPAKLVEAARYRAGFSRYRTGTWVAEAAASGAGLRVTLSDGRRRIDEDCDLLACGYGLVPNLELARLLGCRIAEGAVVVDEGQQTTVPGVLAAGEACGVGGADLALVEGELAGRAAAGLSPRAGLVDRRARLRVFARRLDEAFAPRPELMDLARADTVVCRCEDVPRGRLRPEWTPRQAKLYTRAGMGPCQGRVCGPALDLLFGWPPDTVRPPLYPVPFASLEEDEA
jgi:NADPH-dependent 2,4-dienoyl-CoA reductase/sulfur reductase-like enzyme